MDCAGVVRIVFLILRLISLFLFCIVTHNIYDLEMFHKRVL